MKWTFDIGGVQKTIAEWKAQDVSLRLASLDTDVLSFTLPKALFDADPIVPFNGTIKLYRDGVKWFEGRRLLSPGRADASAELQTYTFGGPWLWLTQNIFQQQWYQGVFTSHIISMGSSSQILTAVLNYAIANGAPLIVAAHNIPVMPPSNEFTGKTCAAVILDALQFAPDTIGWFDYTTSPPTLHFAQRPAIPVASLRTADAASTLGQRVSVIQITPRPDLQVPSVKIVSETIVTVNNSKRLIPGVQIYPPGATGREDRAFCDCVILQGQNRTTVSADLTCAAIQATEDAAGIAWFKSKIETLNDTRYNIKRIVPGSLKRAGADGGISLGYPNEVLEGAIAEWMSDGSGNLIASQRETITVRFDIDLYTGLDRTEVAKLEGASDYEFTVDVTATNAPPGDSSYEALESVEDGDPSIAGLAQYLYQSLSVLHYDATFQLVEDECLGGIGIGQVVNLFGSRAEFQAMRALIQGVSFNIDNGMTEITCGPPRHLSINDILTLLRANRIRRRWTNPATQSTGDISSAGQVTLAKGLPSANAIPGAGVTSYMAAVSGVNKITMDAGALKLKMDRSTTPTQKLNIDFANTDWVAAVNKELKPKIVTVCVNNDNGYLMLIIGSEPWKP